MPGLYLYLRSLLFYFFFLSVNVFSVVVALRMINLFREEKLGNDFSFFGHTHSFWSHTSFFNDFHEMFEYQWLEKIPTLDACKSRIASFFLGLEFAFRDL